VSPFKAARAYARLSRCYFSSNLRSALEYRANFIVQVLGMVINNAAFIVFWKVLISRAGAVAGYAFEDIMFLWALAASAFGIAHIVFGNAPRLGRLVMSGELDVFLLQPKNVLINASLARTEVSAWGDLIYGVLLLAIVTRPDPLRWLLFALFSISGAVIYSASFVLIESLYFFLGNAQGLSKAFFELILSSTLYPDRIFAPPVRALFYSLVPAGYIVFIPLKAFKSLDPLSGALAIGASAAYAAIAFLAFGAGLRRYESGNLIGTRS
jgi:ABC-2 type transport system permease protein